MNQAIKMHQLPPYLLNLSKSILKSVIYEDKYVKRKYKWKFKLTETIKRSHY